MVGWRACDQYSQATSTHPDMWRVDGTVDVIDQPRAAHRPPDSLPGDVAGHDGPTLGLPQVSEGGTESTAAPAMGVVTHVRVALLGVLSAARNAFLAR